jgi:hypothetical protein
MGGCGLCELLGDKAIYDRLLKSHGSAIDQQIKCQRRKSLTIHTRGRDRAFGTRTARQRPSNSRDDLILQKLMRSWCHTLTSFHDLGSIDRRHMPSIMLEEVEGEERRGEPSTLT